MDKETEFDLKESRVCQIRSNCEYSCTTCPYDSEVVERWRNKEDGNISR